jgi:hypothetical protein
MKEPKRHSHRAYKGMRKSIVKCRRAPVSGPITDEYIESLKGSLGSNGKAMKILLREKKREHYR